MMPFRNLLFVVSSEKPIIALGTDHAGFAYKEAVGRMLQSEGYTVCDFGAFSSEPCDYPDFIRPAARAVGAGEADFGFVFGGSGNGEAIVANKVPGVRCGLCWNPWSVEMTRKHNDANIMAIGSRAVTLEDTLNMVRQFLSTPFEGGRHLRRVKKIEGSTLPHPC